MTWYVISYLIHDIKDHRAYTIRWKWEVEFKALLLLLLCIHFLKIRLMLMSTTFSITWLFMRHGAFTFGWYPAPTAAKCSRKENHSNYAENSAFRKYCQLPVSVISWWSCSLSSYKCHRSPESSNLKFQIFEDLMPQLHRLTEKCCRVTTPSK